MYSNNWLDSDDAADIGILFKGIFAIELYFE